ncbi:MAG: adenylosuccinate synthetase [Alphaproteobacteria bacterium]|nr:MAG: adenylosuccinate synthetase [Alphaproteobacteria bacterium]
MLASKHGALVIKTRELLQQLNPELADDRVALQKAGEQRDRKDKGAWIAEALSLRIAQIAENDVPGLVVVDSVRIPGQVDALRRAFGSLVHHIHLRAQPATLESRWRERDGKSPGITRYEDLSNSTTERNVDRLASIADLVVETDRCTADAVCVRATALLQLYSRSSARNVDVLVGGQYGSEGKGNIVAHIAPEYELLVRVGGPNAGHQVFGDPVEVYYHLPSGSERAPRAKILLGAGAVINVEKLLLEIQTHKLEKGRLFIDRNALVIEERDLVLEKEKLHVIGSTGQGVGAASARRIIDRGQPAPDNVRQAKHIPELRDYLCDAQEILEAAYLRQAPILLEGTQGTSLSLLHGPYPFVTSRDTTAQGCLSDAGIAASRVRRVIMVCRTYPIRVGGTSGDLDLETDWTTIEQRAGLEAGSLKAKEKTTTTKRDRRVGEFDWVQLRRSSLLNAPTDIAITFADYISAKNKNAYRFEQLSPESLRFVDEVERVSGSRVSLISTDFSWRNVIDRRAW